jgi:dihydrofolate reductase
MITHQSSPTAIQKARKQRGACFVEGFAIVSADGMIADAAGVMPDALKIDADQRFFEHGLDAVDLVVHGRHSHEQQPRSDSRRRIVLTRRVPALAPHPSIEKAVLWNPAGASFEDALNLLGMSDGRVGVIGGPDVFDLFLDRYDVFHLSRTPGLKLPGGRPVFHGVPERTPENILSARGLTSEKREVLDAVKGVEVVSWCRT